MFEMDRHEHNVLQWRVLLAFVQFREVAGKDVWWNVLKLRHQLTERVVAHGVDEVLEHFFCVARGHDEKDMTLISLMFYSKRVVLFIKNELFSSTIEMIKQ